MKSNIAFSKLNYYIILAGVLVIIVGFILMAGGGSDDPKIPSTEIFNFRRLTLAPYVVISGFIVVLFGIMKKSSQADSAPSSEDHFDMDA